jgi:hypothetical protein
MHKHRKFRHHRGYHHGWGWGPFHGGFWWIGLAILFWSGEWWPGILILCGLSMVFGSFFREEKKERPQEWQDWAKGWEEPPAPHHEPSPPPAAPPAYQFHRADSLPATCSHCGGPIRSYEVKWRGERSAACPYCGSNLKMK